MSWSIAAAVSNTSDISPQLRHDLRQAIEQGGTERHCHLETPFSQVSVGWSDWAPPPLAQSSDGSLNFVLIGEYFEQARLAPAEILLRYRQRGISALEGLNGRYIALLTDEKRQYLGLVSDPLGLRKLYQHKLADQLLLCSSLEFFRFIHGFKARLDPYGAAQLLITSHLCDHNTLLDGVSLVPPATRLSCDRSGVRQTCYWQPSIEPNKMDLESGIEMMQQEARRALECRMQNAESLLLPLSGGLDSRFLAGLLSPSLYERTHTCSYGHGHSYDRRIGRRVSSALKLPHQSLDLPKKIYQEYKQRALLLADGEVSIEAFPLFRLLDAGTAGTTLLSGYAGDWISAKKLLYEKQSPAESMAYLWQKLYVRMGFTKERYGEVVCHPGLRDGYPRLQKNMYDIFDQADAPSFAEKAQLLEFWHRQRRYVTYQLKALEHRFRVVAPLCDTELVKHWLNLPLALKEGQRGYRNLIHEVSPRLAGLPVAGSFRYHALDQDTPTRRLDTVSRLQRSLKRSRLDERLIWRLNGGLNHVGRFVVSVSGGWLGPHNRGLLVHHEEDIRHHNPEWFKQQLFDQEMADGFYDVRGLRRLWDEHQRGLQNNSVRINNLIMLSAFRRHWSL